MALKIRLEIVSAEGALVTCSAEMVVLPAEAGEIGVMPGHAPLLTRLKPGLAKVKVSPQEEYSYFISGGIAEVQPNIVTVLADTVVRSQEMDRAQALAAQEKVEKALKRKTSEEEISRLNAELKVILSYLHVLEQVRKKNR